MIVNRPPDVTKQTDPWLRPRPHHTAAIASRLLSAPRDEAGIEPQEFVRQLEREKRRADRCKSPLSIILFRPRAAEPLLPSHGRRLLLRAGSTMRETDVLGRVSDGALGMLLPATDAHGAQSFLERLHLTHEDRAAVAVVLETYPDGIFHELANGNAGKVDDAALDTAPPGRSIDVAVKRALDLVLSVVLIALAAPLMLLVGLAIRGTSAGPAIFSQVRLGKGGRPFRFYKFRSMYRDCDDRIHRDFVGSLIRGEHERIDQQDAAHPLFKMACDPRVTPVGKFIRRSSIDELPQLFNVLKGDMSLVGPRPPLAYEATLYQSWHLRRILEVRPGITGLWQVEGRSKVSFDEMVRMDLRYIRNRSVLYDLVLLLRTVKVVLAGSGAK